MSKYELGDVVMVQSETLKGARTIFVLTEELGKDGTITVTYESGEEIFKEEDVLGRMVLEKPRAKKLPTEELLVEVKAGVP